MLIQLQILNKILQNSDMSLVLLNNLTKEHFFNFEQEFIFIQDHYTKYRAVPDRLTFAETFPDFDFSDVKEPDSYLIEQLFKDFNAKQIAESFNDIKKYLEADDISAAIRQLEATVNNAHKGSALTCTNLFEDTSRYEKYIDRLDNRNKYYISTGFAELDKMIGGIDVREENMVLAARTGIGKSWTLLKIAVEAAKQGRTVGIYSGEMSADKVGYRIDSLLGHIDNKAITRGLPTDPSLPVTYRHYLNNIKSFCPGVIKVLTPIDIQGPATVSALRAFVEKEHIDILLIDQYSLLEDQHNTKIMHERVANISKDIKNLQVMMQIPIVSVSQMNRSKNENGEQDTTQIGLSDRIGQDATTIIMLDRDIIYADADKQVIKDDRLILNVVKSRDGGSGKLCYKADFNFGEFRYLNPELTEQESEDLRSQYEDSSVNEVPW